MMGTIINIYVRSSQQSAARLMSAAVSTQQPDFKSGLRNTGCGERDLRNRLRNADCIKIQRIF